MRPTSSPATATGHSAIGYVAPADIMAGRHARILAERDRKREVARDARRARRSEQAQKEAA